MSFAGSDYLPFLGLALLLFPFLPVRLRPHGMLAFSYAFYVAHTPWHLGVLVASTALDYFVGRALEKTANRGARRALLAVSVVGNVGLLSVFKYTGGVQLALGISFYTFQSLSYSIDVFRRVRKPCHDPVEFALYVAFFPQLLAGPIERASHLMPQLRALRPAGLVALESGGRLILWGLWKKLCLADRFRPELLAQLNQPEGLDAVTIAHMALGLNVALYLDFSGYTDIARGSARLFGVDLVKNFDRPYLATSVGDFTRRWHTSLIQWITDYVWAPLLRGRTQLPRLFAINLGVMVLFALWHDLRWTYIPPAIALGLFISFEQAARLRRLKLGRRGPKAPAGAASRVRAVAGWAMTLLIWSAFTLALMAPDAATLGRVWSALGHFAAPSIQSLGALAPLTAVMAIGLAIQLADRNREFGARWEKLPMAARGLILVACVLLIARFQASGSQDFTYFQF